MNSGHNEEPFVVFTPPLGRFIVTEAWSAALSVSLTGALLYTLGTMRQVWLVIRDRSGAEAMRMTGTR